MKRSCHLPSKLNKFRPYRPHVNWEEKGKPGLHYFIIAIALLFAARFAVQFVRAFQKGVASIPLSIFSQEEYRPDENFTMFWFAVGANGFVMFIAVVISIYQAIQISEGR